ncbi:MAG: hypothetical protein HYZ53_11555 [Planctomycetes bacterium]|nr:hypothetical protein [Planctomycetota bacterium]
MKFDRLLILASEWPCFDLATLVQLAGEKRSTVLVQLSRWMRQKRVLPLRRGLYTLGAVYRRHPLRPALLANRLHAPSYLSFHWALGYHALIPEGVLLYTSATTRAPRTVRNALGSFRYRHLKRPFFFGYEPVELDGERVLVATPEKALLDFWHLERGEWTIERMAAMRFQGFEGVSMSRLEEYAQRFRSPRLRRALEAWRAFVRAEAQGTREL